MTCTGVFADDCPVRLDDRAHQGRLPVAVLVASQHDPTRR